MTKGTFTLSISDIVYRTFLDGKTLFRNFVDENSLDSKKSTVGTYMCCELSKAAAKFGVLLFPNGRDSAG